MEISDCRLNMLKNYLVYALQGIYMILYISKLFHQLDEEIFKTTSIYNWQLSVSLENAIDMTKHVD
jgi:hypothetical protein